MADDSNTPMTRWGIGLKLAAYSAALCAPLIGLGIYAPDRFRIDILPTSVRLAIGIIAAVLGLILYVTGAVTAMRAFTRGRLCTTGPFRVCRHPIYGAWITLILPGLSLLLDSWIFLAIPVVLYVVMRLLIRTEEDYLAERFGDEYRAYRRRTPAVLPIGWIRRLGFNHRR